MVLSCIIFFKNDQNNFNIEIQWIILLYFSTLELKKIKIIRFKLAYFKGKKLLKTKVLFEDLK